MSDLERNLWWRWVLVTTLGWTVMGLSSVARWDALVWIGGLVCLTGQWMLLRSAVRGAHWWLLATPLGWLVGAGLIVALAWARGLDPLHAAVAHGALQTNLASSLLVGLATGAGLGLTQWYVLRQSVRNASWWLVANVVAGVVGAAVALWVREAVMPMQGVVEGLIFGVSTGAALVGTAQPGRSPAVADFELARARESGRLAPAVVRSAPVISLEAVRRRGRHNRAA